MVQGLLLVEKVLEMRAEHGGNKFSDKKKQKLFFRGCRIYVY